LLVSSRVLCTSLLLLCFFFVVFLTWTSWRRRPSLRNSIASLKEVVATMTELSHTPTQRCSPSMPPPSRMLEDRVVPPSTPSRARLNSTVVRRSLPLHSLQLAFSCLFSTPFVITAWQCCCCLVFCSPLLLSPLVMRSLVSTSLVSVWPTSRSTVGPAMLLESSRSGKRWKSFQWFARESKSYCSICIFRSCNKIKLLSSDAINMPVIRILLECGIILQSCIFKNILQILTHTYQSSSFHLR